MPARRSRTGSGRQRSGNNSDGSGSGSGRSGSGSTRLWLCLTLTLCFVAVPLVATLRLVASGDHPGIGIGGLRSQQPKQTRVLEEPSMNSASTSGVNDVWGTPQTYSAAAAPASGINAAATPPVTPPPPSAAAAATAAQLNAQIADLQQQLEGCKSSLRLALKGDAPPVAAPAPAASCPPCAACPPAANCPACPSAPPAAAAAIAAPSTPAGGGLPYIVFGIPTVPRRGGKDYLNPTLDFLLEQLPEDPEHPMFGKIVLFVQFNDKGTERHTAFENARERMKTHPKGVYVKFQVHASVTEPAGAVDGRSTANVPSPRVRQQSRDVVALVRAAAPLAKYYMFMEDDFRYCPHAFTATQYLIEKATRLYPDWIVLRVSFGLNGALLKSADALAYAAYLEKHIRRRPPDHMLVEWFAGETAESKAYTRGRPHIAFRHNMFEHIGARSTLRTSASPQYAACYEQLLDPVLFEVEAFKPGECGHTDIWPCPPRNSKQLHPTLDWKQLGTQIKRIPSL